MSEQYLSYTIEPQKSFIFTLIADCGLKNIFTESAPRLIQSYSRDVRDSGVIDNSKHPLPEVVETSGQWVYC